MIEPFSIWLRRAEGKISECVEVTVTSFAAADAVLRGWALSAPKGGSYHKCDFRVTYADREKYEGRFDLEHGHASKSDLLGAHMRSYLEFHAGRHCPPHITEQQYRAYLNEHGGEKRQKECADFLIKYRVGV